MLLLLLLWCFFVVVVAVVSRLIVIVGDGAVIISFSMKFLLILTYVIDVQERASERFFLLVLFGILYGKMLIDNIA